MLTRRSTIGAGIGLVALGGLGRPAIAQGAANTLRFVPYADLSSLDPIWTTAYVIRNHGYLVYDTLYAPDSKLHVRPQMAEGHDTSSDGLTWTIRLREGLRFHDGAPVLARDCIASIRRWAARAGLGQLLMSRTDDLSATDDRTMRFRLKSPFPLLIEALGTGSSPVPFMMPERIAATAPNVQIKDATGSGPFRFLAGEWVQGSHAAYARFDGYRPRAEAPDGTAGGKVAHVDRVEWTTIPDAATAMAAIQTGSVDWVEQPPPDLIPLVSTRADITVTTLDPIGNVVLMRFNHLYPPFNDIRARQAVLAAVDQTEFLTAAWGDPKWFSVCKSFFACGTPMSTGAGSEVMVGRIETAKALLADSDYRGAPAVILAPTDVPAQHALGQVAADLLKRIGMKVDLVETDWASVVVRRASQAPPDKGGWSIFHTTATAVEFPNPAAHLALRADGLAAWAGWPTDPELERLKADWIAAPDLAAQRSVAAEVEQEAFTSVPYVPLGQVHQPTVWRTNIVDVVPSFAPLAWGLRKT